MQNTVNFLENVLPRMDRNFYGPTSYIMSMSVSSVAVSAKINKLILLTF